MDAQFGLTLVQCYHLVANDLCGSDEIDTAVWPWVEAIAFTSSNNNNNNNTAFI